MQAFFLIIVLIAVCSILKNYEPISKRMDRMDQNPSNRIKSDKWLKNNINK